MSLAWAALEGRSARDLARSSGARSDGDEVVLPVLGSEMIFDVRDRTVTAPPELPGCWGLIALHHLNGCSGWKRDDEWMSFEQSPDAVPFAAAFRQRAVVPLASRFGDRPADLLRRGRRLGGRPLGMGDASIVLQTFPRLRIAVVIWRGDGEIPAGANVLFDRGGAATLPAEDLAETGISICQMLISIDQ